ncbi:MAG: OsmC family peroxiredoxin [Chloroflexota bacterium]
MAREAISKASAIWEGDLVHGKGSFSLASGAAGTIPVTWAGRTERTPGSTSPEELLAAAHAACYAMAFSNVLASKGHPATRLDVSATCVFAPIEGGFKIASMALEVRGTVPGLDQAGFEEAARQGEQGCPVSNALRNNLEISVKATLA